MGVVERIQYSEADLRSGIDAIARLGITVAEAGRRFSEFAELLRQADLDEGLGVDVGIDESHAMTLAELLDGIDEVLAEVRDPRSLKALDLAT